MFPLTDTSRLRWPEAETSIDQGDHSCVQANGMGEERRWEAYPGLLDPDCQGDKLPLERP